jgi:transketolase
MGLYPILADLDFFSRTEIQKYGTGDGILRIFGNLSIPGIEATTGSLGHGQGVGAGFALAAKKDFSNQKTFVIISEGEMYEGSVWETALFASQQKLDNLILILDRNHKIILGDTEDIVKLSPIDEKWKSFGWETHNVDGHSIEELQKVFKEVDNCNGKLKIIIANTVKGKGCSIMEHKPEWHYWYGMTEEQIEQTRKVSN